MYYNRTVNNVSFHDVQRMQDIRLNLTTEKLGDNRKQVFIHNIHFKSGHIVASGVMLNIRQCVFEYSSLIFAPESLYNTGFNNFQVQESCNSINVSLTHSTWLPVQHENGTIVPKLQIAVFFKCFHMNITIRSCHINGRRLFFTLGYGSIRFIQVVFVGMEPNITQGGITLSSYHHSNNISHNKTVHFEISDSHFENLTYEGVPRSKETGPVTF